LGSIIIQLYADEYSPSVDQASVDAERPKVMENRTFHTCDMVKKPIWFK